MSKADRAKKRAAKAAKAKLPGLAATPKREKSGRKQRETSAKIGAERHPDRVALNARARHNGMEETHESRRKVSAQSWAGEVGAAIHIGHSGEEAERLHRAYAGWLAADSVYCRRHLGVSRHAKTAKIEMMIGRFETRPDDRPDLRSAEERDRDAVTNWMRWQGYLGQIDPHQASAIKSGDLYALVKDGRDGPVLTRQGQVFVAGLEALADIVGEHS